MKNRCVYFPALLTFVFSYGCPSVSFPEDNTDTGNHDMTTENGDIDADSGDDTDDTLPAGNDDDDVTLTEVQAKSIDSAILAAETVVQAVIAIMPVQQIEEIVAGSAAVPTCPGIDIDFQSDSLLLTLDYGTGCTTSVHPALVWTGTLSGELFLGVNAIELAITDLSVLERTLHGRVAGGYSASVDSATFAVNVNITLDDGTGVNGGATVVIDNLSGAAAITDATIAVREGGAMPDLTIVLEDVLSSPGETGLLTPQSGRATYQVEDDPAHPNGSRLAVEFTAATPVDHTVNVAIEDAAAITFTPEPQ